jgi:hypothetical protein
MTQAHEKTPSNPIQTRLDEDTMNRGLSHINEILWLIPLIEVHHPCAAARLP